MSFTTTATAIAKSSPMPIANFTITEWKSNSNSNNRNRYNHTLTVVSTSSPSTNTLDTLTSSSQSSVKNCFSTTDIGHYRLQKVLNNLEEMATLPSPRSPKWNQALYSPIQNLPTTRFPNADERYDYEQLRDVMLETEKERETIHNQPYRTTQLILPGAKPRPDLVNNKLTGKGLRPTTWRPLDQKSVVATLDENRALVNRQFNSPRSLYSNQNVAEAVYVQTGVNLKNTSRQNSGNAPIHLKPSTLKEFNPELSPTYRALVEDEVGQYHQPAPAQLLPAPHIQQNRPPPQNRGQNTAPSSVPLNSVGQPTHRIAQSESFRRLMINVLGY